ADPIAGVHACVALLAALEHRRSTGEGQLIEAAQIEVGAAVTAEPVIEYSLTGSVRAREGNRHREYAQGVYATSNVDEWVALSVRDDADWLAILDATDRPDLRDDPRFATAKARRENHDEFDGLLTDWTRGRPADELVATLGRHGVPAERLLTADQMYDVEQLDARGFYQDLDHPITGRHRFPGWPFRISPGPAHQHRTAAPTLGQHNAEVLGALGLSDQEIAALCEQRIIGHRVLNG
ncbi:CoA transferase, partial [Mycobacterium sp.]|uniref:CoA transferase n=1 Tax=Mycobacterium sp. TaxID=1785 RepID=UPI00262418E8